MFNQIVTSTLDAASATPAPASALLPVSPVAAWALILGVLAVAALALWLLRDIPTDLQKPDQPPSYREAA